MNSPDRVFSLKQIDGKAPTSSTGIVDKRLFTGENKLHAVQDTSTMLWGLKYEQGGLPPIFKQQFTSFASMMKFVKDYFSRRNIEVLQVA